MFHLKLKLMGTLVLFTTAGFAQVTSTPRSHGRDSDNKPAPNSSVSRGQQVFMQNCSRCHDAPEKIPQQVTGTIAKHMRVRAKLSGDDYRALLQFLQK
jgi:cytochrome c5